MQTIDQIKQQVVSVCKKYNCKKIAVFGSYAKGTAREESSDIDLLVYPPSKLGLIRFASMKLDLEKALQKKVDLITYRSISPYMKDSILNSAYTLYEE
ncbi:hypothetical protein A3A93_03240 [Candidatus Roizmanbacteria bacterium RIFCSPLOWO2_01_FULL_38_12]|uniref:Polymerase nucleotidyl transferase domain-containing protein n=1 Tax=Candidatus Roizmanbacteria bacterium RIFCSPLOWO2_01_FULL_38_12 TaxID=1802061 RepID=A0A1F7ISN0_9BACT|nr:MAG: hypothetical protein A2861_03905 [Candidatus Roizmanbacteria bacterium RIFCSPHIGHO2_01_FULL_38_15]OGK35789.1 MAG: hypothetical protein A3F59_03530 [Candidatus Roizmanbacteria bacterium RIFCSPHIGHO2_12_FULL_38_13]OGK46362.1 MAG: hypothetical protein A3A93_03240 [Candidatus Roizmanbacteria bacterium RIFCSPLOWO2_01_FULL_38_12]